MVAAHGDTAYAFDFFVTSMLWTVIAAALVFLMHLGFATLECGLTQSKNVVNILYKNGFIICMGLLTYAFFGFNTHYPGDFNGWFSWGGMIGDLNADGENATFGYGGVGLCMTGYGDFIFQAMFAATAATIVSGAVAERVKLLPFLIFATVLVGFAYPVVGSWHWGGGWLEQPERRSRFQGLCRLRSGARLRWLRRPCLCDHLGPPQRQVYRRQDPPIPGHNMPLAAIGVLLLWFGWYGFNGGSVLSAEPAALGSGVHHYLLGRCCRRIHGRHHLLDHDQEAGPLHVTERHACRSGGHHRQRRYRFRRRSAIIIGLIAVPSSTSQSSPWTR